MNREKLLEIADLIDSLQNPEQFNIGSWVTEIKDIGEYVPDEYGELIGPDGFHADFVSPSGNYVYQELSVVYSNAFIKELDMCQTAGCIAGWVVLDACSVNPEIADKVHRVSDIPFVAKGILDLTDDESWRLFYISKESVWAEHAEEFNVQYDEYGSIDPKSISNKSAAKMLRGIAYGIYSLSGNESGN